MGKTIQPFISDRKLVFKIRNMAEHVIQIGLISSRTLVSGKQKGCIALALRQAERLNRQRRDYEQLNSNADIE